MRLGQDVRRELHRSHVHSASRGADTPVDRCARSALHGESIPESCVYQRSKTPKRATRGAAPAGRPCRVKVLYHLWACTRKQLVKDLFKRIIGFESWQMNDLEVPMDGRASSQPILCPPKPSYRLTKCHGEISRVNVPQTSLIGNSAASETPQSSARLRGRTVESQTGEHPVPSVDPRRVLEWKALLDNRHGAVIWTHVLAAGQGLRRCREGEPRAIRDRERKRRRSDGAERLMTRYCTTFVS